MQDELQKISAYLRKEQTKDALRKLNRLLEKVHANIEDEDNWQKVGENNFNIVHNNFLSRLKERYPRSYIQRIKISRIYPYGFNHQRSCTTIQSIGTGHGISTIQA